MLPVNDLKNYIKTIFKKYNLEPNKLMGQNFLIDKQVLSNIAKASNISKNDTILEIGPGLGILTEELAKHAGSVVAVEKDRKLAKIVRSILIDKNIRNVEIIEGDILKTTNYKLQTINYKIVANIPYYLTSHLIRGFLECENPPKEMILMIQKEVAQRICARPPKMSLLAVSVQFYAKPKIIEFVSKKSFWPQPKVDSAIIKIIPHPSPLLIKGSEQGKFFLIVKAGFSHPRKQLINNLPIGLKIERSKIAKALKKIGLTPEQRAETLSVNEWLELAALLANNL